MAISKKSLGKVLALSMASAMAMSSLSAALVSVAAVQDPALASNGSVDYTGSAGQSDICSLFDLRDIDDDTVEVIGDGITNLNTLSDRLKQPDVFTYTDADDLERSVEKVTVDYKVTSGSSYLRYYSKDTTDNKAGDLVAQNKSGSATLQIKISGEVDLGGGKGTKKVTFTQDIHFDVHEKDSIGLEVFRGEDKPVYDADLDKLAAYGESLTFVLVKYTPAADGFLANFTNLQSGSLINPDPGPGPGPEETPVDKVVAATNLQNAGLASSENAIKAFRPLLSAGTDGKVTIAPAANIPAALKTLVDNGSILATDILVPESAPGAGDAITVQNVLDDTAGTGAAKTLADKLAAAVKQLGLNPDAPPPAEVTKEDQLKAIKAALTTRLNEKGVTDQTAIDAFLANVEANITYDETTKQYNIAADKWAELTKTENQTIQASVPLYYEEGDEDVAPAVKNFLETTTDRTGKEAYAYQVTTQAAAPAPQAEGDTTLPATVTQYFVNTKVSTGKNTTIDIGEGDLAKTIYKVATETSGNREVPVQKNLLANGTDAKIIEGNAVAVKKLEIDTANTTQAAVDAAYTAAKTNNDPAWANIFKVGNDYYTSEATTRDDVTADKTDAGTASLGQSAQKTNILNQIKDFVAGTSELGVVEGLEDAVIVDNTALKSAVDAALTFNKATDTDPAQWTVTDAAAWTTLAAVDLTKDQFYTEAEAKAMIGNQVDEVVADSNSAKTPIYTVPGVVTKYYGAASSKVIYGYKKATLPTATTTTPDDGQLFTVGAATHDLVEVSADKFEAFNIEAGTKETVTIDNQNATWNTARTELQDDAGDLNTDKSKWPRYYKGAVKLDFVTGVTKDNVADKIDAFLQSTDSAAASENFKTLADAGIVTDADGNYYWLNEAKADGTDPTKIEDTFGTDTSDLQNIFKYTTTTEKVLVDWTKGTCTVVTPVEDVAELSFVGGSGSDAPIKVAAKTFGDVFYSDKGTADTNKQRFEDFLEAAAEATGGSVQTRAFKQDFAQTTDASGNKVPVTADVVQLSDTKEYITVADGEKVVTAYQMEFVEGVENGKNAPAVTVSEGENAILKDQTDLQGVLDAAKGTTTTTTPDQGTTTPETPAENQPAAQADDDKPLPTGTNKAESVRFYSGAGQEMFEVGNGSEGSNTEWKRSTKTDKKAEENSIYKTADGTLVLNTKGNTGASTVKVAYSYTEEGKEIVKELTKNVKVIKAADFGGQSITIDKTGSKTIVDDGGHVESVRDKNLSGFEIRTDGSVTMKNGNIGDITRAGSVSVQGGKAGKIDVGGDVTVAEDGVVGDITGAGKVTIEEGGEAGAITEGTELILNEGKVKSIDIVGKVTILGGIVTGDVRTNGTIEITSNETDTNNHALDTEIGGNVTLLARAAERADNIADGIIINNESEDGAATLKIGGNVIAKHVDTGLNSENDSPTLQVGDTETTGLIQIAGVIEGEKIQLGGNGLVSLGSVRGASEVKHLDDDGQIIDSTLTFEGFNSAIDSITNFADVKITDGTVTVNNELKANNLTVSSNAQLVANKIDIEDDILESGSIVVPAGNLVVTGNVDDTPSLALTGDVTENTLAYVGNRGLVDAFDMGGITLRAERQTNGDYNYVVASATLSGLTAVGKDVAIGEKQDKAVSVVLDGALPEGASIVWESDDRDIATVSGEGNQATISGVKVGSTTIKAMVVDANGRDLGYTDAIFDITVLDHATVDAIGSALALDTKAVGMDVGQSYSFLVRENSDVDNIKLSYDSNIVDVALAQADYNGRGALYTITAKANGSTNVTVNYKGASSSVAVKVGGFKLDTAKKDLAPGQTYSFLAKNVPADQAANVKLEYDTNVATVALAQADYNGRGALFTVTGNQVGSTEIKATYNNEEAVMAVNVVEYTGRMTLDTASYTMPFGGTYTIGVKIEQNGRQLSGEEVNAMIARGELRVRDSRTGTIINAPQVLANGNVRVTGKSTEGTTYVLFEVIQNGQVVTHASVGVTVQAGAQAHGSSRRSISQW